jgi:hypothetical protein
VKQGGLDVTVPRSLILSHFMEKKVITSWWGIPSKLLTQDAGRKDGISLML